MSGGRLIPDAVAADILRIASETIDAQVRAILIHPDDLTWEAKLALAIERQSVRNRVRRRASAFRHLVRDVPRRLRNARAALAGEWEAEDDW